MERPLNEIYQSLQKLMGLHRQLMDTVRAEREALVQADLKAIQDTTCAKQGLIEAIKQAESERLKHTGALALLWKKPLKDLTLPNIIIQVQGTDLKTAEQFRGVFSALTHLVKRISEQNEDNRGLVQRSLEHVQEMKVNVLGESTPKSNTYTPKAKKSSGAAGARLISKEA